MRILLVEDDAVLQDMLQRSLQDAGHRVDVAGTLADARHWLRVQAFDAIVLDLNLPDGNGLSLLPQVRREGARTPVLALTARNRPDERVAGLDAGADDYLGKPFDLAEVEARLRALLRRATGVDEQHRFGRLVLDRVARRFTVGADPLELPAREFEVLWELMTPPGRVVSKKQLSDKLSGFDDALGDNALEAFISRLRRKLAGADVVIRTFRGLGYALEGAP